MSRTVMDVDDRALAAVMREYRTTVKVDAVNRALREIAERRTARLRKFSKVMDRMAESMQDIDWDTAYREHDA